MGTKLVVKVNSDNFQDALMSVEAYRELRLQMSSGDFGSHSHTMLEVDQDAEILELEDLSDPVSEDEVAEYLSQWKQEDETCDLSVALNEGLVEYAANILARSGIINPEDQHGRNRMIEDEIINMAEAWDAQSPRKKTKELNSAFKNYNVFKCAGCNYTAYALKNESKPELCVSCAGHNTFIRLK